MSITRASQSINRLLAELENVASTPFEKAVPRPAELNHSEEFLQREVESIFSQEWICVGRADEVAQHGDYLTHEIADVPVLIIRQENGDIAAFVNTCAHRFACLMPKEQGSAKRLTCRYHAWTYGTDGQLLRAPHMEMKEGFNPSQHGLRQLHCETWEGFVYVSLAVAPTTTLQQALSPFRDNIVGRFDMSCYQTVMRETMVWNANWKNLIENFTESYHVPVVHAKTFAKHKKPVSEYGCGEDSDYYGYHYATQTADSGLGAAHPNNDRLSGQWRRMMVDFCIFPSHLVTLLPDYLWYISVQPEGVDKMRATWGVAVPPEVLADIPADEYESWLTDFRRFMDVANDEDKPRVEALFRGSRSPLLPVGTYHPIEKNLWQFTRYLSRLCNRTEGLTDSI